MPICGQPHKGIVKVDGSEQVQIESITFSWCQFPQALEYIQEALSGQMDDNDFVTVCSLALDTPEKHQQDKDFLVNAGFRPERTCCLLLLGLGTERKHRRQ